MTAHSFYISLIRFTPLSRLLCCLCGTDKGSTHFCVSFVIVKKKIPKAWDEYFVFIADVFSIVTIIYLNHFYQGIKRIEWIITDNVYYTSRYVKIKSCQDLQRFCSHQETLWLKDMFCEQQPKADVFNPPGRRRKQWWWWQLLTVWLKGEWQYEIWSFER